jgi:environmental stress-induced protein Ves
VNELADGLTIVHADDVAPSSWKNGGGVTRELMRMPLPGRAHDDWLLRISVADIAADGPFSPFDGVTRWFAVLSGHGVDLRWPLADGGAMRKLVTPRSEPVEFDGARAPDCRLIDGPTRDLNIMVRRAGGSAVLAAAQAESPWLWSGTGRGVFTRRPAELVGAGRPRCMLSAHSLLWVADERARDMAAWSLREIPARAETSLQTGDRAVRPVDTGPLGYWIGFTAASGDDTR